MAALIDDLQIQGVSFCGYNSMAVLLNKLGYDLVLDVLSLEWNFLFSRRYERGICEEYEKWLPDYYISTESSTIKQLLEKFFNLKIKYIIAKDKKEYMVRLKKCINAGIAAVVAVDVKYLKYFIEYQNSHSESFHYVTICGYSEDKIYFLDSFRSFIEGEIHSVSYNEFYNMVQPEDNVFHLKLEFIVLERISSKNVRDMHIEKMHFIKSIDKMLEEKAPIFENGWVKYSGLCALKEFSKEMILISKIGDENLIEGYIKKFVPMIIMCAQQRKGNIAYIKRMIINASKDAESVFKLCKNLYQKWEYLKITFCNVRKREWKIVAETTSLIIQDIYSIELELLLYVKRMDW